MRAWCFLCAVSLTTWLFHRCARSVCCVCNVLGHLAPVHQYARAVCCIVCAVSLATWLLFTGVPTRCVVLRVRCPWPLGSCALVCPPAVLWVPFPWPRGSCSPVCLLHVLCCVCGVPGHLAPVHRCARLVCCVRAECTALSHRGNWVELVSQLTFRAQVFVQDIVGMVACETVQTMTLLERQTDAIGA